MLCLILLYYEVLILINSSGSFTYSIPLQRSVRACVRVCACVHACVRACVCVLYTLSF